MAGHPLTVPDWMEPSTIGEVFHLHWCRPNCSYFLAISQIIIHSAVYFFLHSSGPPTPLLVPVTFMFLFLTLTFIHSLLWACKWVWLLDPVTRELCYLDVFTICSSSNSESLAEDQQQRNATSYCFLILIYLSCFYHLRVRVIFLMIALCSLCGVEWEQWGWENCPFNLLKEKKN